MEHDPGLWDQRTGGPAVGPPFVPAIGQLTLWPARMLYQVPNLVRQDPHVPEGGLVQRQEDDGGLGPSSDEEAVVANVSPATTAPQGCGVLNQVIERRVPQAKPPRMPNHQF